MERFTQKPDSESNSQEGPTIRTDLSEDELRLLIQVRTPMILERIANLERAGTITREVLETEITI